jgi:Uma2 family endonuclease
MYNRAVDVVYETEAPFAIRTDLGPYREADYNALPDEPRCELLYGRFVLMTSPVVRHQDVVLRLARLLLDFADTHAGRAIMAPMDVRLADHSVVQPDVLYVTSGNLSVLHERVRGAPDLVIEVLSPSTARRDLGEKLKLYAESGIREYWVVDPVGKAIEFLVADAGAFRLALAEAEVYRSPVIAGLELDLDAFWRSVQD